MTMSVPARVVSKGVVKRAKFDLLSYSKFLQQESNKLQSFGRFPFQQIARRSHSHPLCVLKFDSRMLTLFDESCAVGSASTPVIRNNMNEKDRQDYEHGSRDRPRARSTMW
jgi:hypothetical protein